MIRHVWVTMKKIDVLNRWGWQTSTHVVETGWCLQWPLCMLTNFRGTVFLGFFQDGCLVGGLKGPRSWGESWVQWVSVWSVTKKPCPKLSLLSPSTTARTVGCEDAMYAFASTIVVQLAQLSEDDTMYAFASGITTAMLSGIGVSICIMIFMTIAALFHRAAMGGKKDRKNGQRKNPVLQLRLETVKHLSFRGIRWAHRTVTTGKTWHFKACTSWIRPSCTTGIPKYFIFLHRLCLRSLHPPHCGFRCACPGSNDSHGAGGGHRPPPRSCCQSDTHTHTQTSRPDLKAAPMVEAEAPAMLVHVSCKTWFSHGFSPRKVCICWWMYQGNIFIETHRKHELASPLLKQFFEQCQKTYHALFQGKVGMIRREFTIWNENTSGHVQPSIKYMLNLCFSTFIISTWQMD